MPEMKIFDWDDNPSETLTLKEVLKWADDICKEAKYLSKKEIKKKLKEFSRYRAGNNKEHDIYLISHSGYERLLRKIYGPLKIDSL